MRDIIGVLLVATLVAGPIEAQPLTKERDVTPTGSSAYDETMGRYLKGLELKSIAWKQASIDAYPWQATLLIRGIPNTHQAHFCNGSIYSDQWILTAAHCVVGVSANQMEIAVGTNVLNEATKRHKVARSIIHADYDKAKRFDSDIALLQLVEPIRLNDRQMAITLITAAEEGVFVDRNELGVIGWGMTEQGGKARDLREAVAPFVSAKRCRLSYRDRVTDKMICAGESQKGSCQGDGGGPLSTVAEPDKVRLVGLVSWGDRCTNPGKYGIYTRVSAFTGWVAACVSGADCPELK